MQLSLPHVANLLTIKKETIMANFTNNDVIIDSRDILGRIEELRLEFFEIDLQEARHLWETDRYKDIPEELEELFHLQDLAEECEQYSSDWIYGETLIHRDYFEQYMDEMVEDCYEVPKDMPYWMSITIDYHALEQDYVSVDFDGEEYLIRSV